MFCTGIGTVIGMDRGMFMFIVIMGIGAGINIPGPLTADMLLLVERVLVVMFGAIMSWVTGAEIGADILLLLLLVWFALVAVEVDEAAVL